MAFSLILPSRAAALSRSLLTALVPRSFLLQHERTTCCSRVHLRRACVRPLLPCATRAARVLGTEQGLVVPPGSLSGFFLFLTAIDASRSRSPSRHPALARGVRSPPSLLRPDRSFSLAFSMRSPARAARASRKTRTPSLLSSACSIPHLALGAIVSATSIPFSIFVLRPLFVFVLLSTFLPIASALFLHLFPASSFSPARMLEGIGYFFLVL